MSAARLAALILFLISACGQSPSDESEVNPAEETLVGTDTQAKAPTRAREEQQYKEGLHVSITDLEEIRTKYNAGNVRIIELVKRLKAEADNPWSFGAHGSRYGGKLAIPGSRDKQCSQLSDNGLDNILPNVGEHIFAKVLAAIILQDNDYAQQAKSLLLEFTSATGFNMVHGVESYSGSNQCALELSLFTPLFIESAMLLTNSDYWNADDTFQIQSWLAKEVYPITSSIAATRKNNWGSAAAFASWAVGHYLMGSGLSLTQKAPSEKTRTPAEARSVHVSDQLNIIGNDWAGDTRCEHFGVQSHGGFPDELRRGSTGCAGRFILDLDSAYYYQITHVSHLVFHAEALRRHGDNDLFEYQLGDGTPMLMRAITFVTHNPAGLSHEWLSTEIGVVRLAAAYYKDPRLCETVRAGFRFTESRYLPYTRLTYADVCP